MGFIWNTMKYVRVPKHALMLQETEGTLSRRWPILWHFCQYRCLLGVGATSLRKPFYLYRSFGGKPVTRYYSLIHTSHVTVKVGPEKTYFWAETRTHEPLTLVATGVKKADLFVRKKSGDTAKRLREYVFTRA